MTSETEKLQALFESVVSLVQSSPSDDYISDDDKLLLYGLYKRCTDGELSESGTPEPAMWNVLANRKRNAWRKCDDLELDEAMERYVELVSGFCNTTGYNCTKLLNEFLSQTTDDADSNTFSSNDEQKPPLIAPKAKVKMIERLTGIKPFVPRGELDISYSDLSHVFIQCLKPNLSFLEAPMRATIRLENEIAQAWSGSHSLKSHVISGLSVRSLVDLYLLSKSYPKGSEVIVVPPIGIEGMMDVIQFHGIKIVPIDIAPYEKDPLIHVDVDKVKQKITESTVAVLVVHPFGMICMDDDEMKSLRQIVDDRNSGRNIEIWEDCAECYAGKEGYKGSEYANVHFYSFGTIKTSTALGGGICVLNGMLDDASKSTSEQMKRILHTLHDAQTRKDYLMKVVKAFLLKCFSRNPCILGVVVCLLAMLGVDYDYLVTSSVKGFPSNTSKDSNMSEMEWKQIKAEKLVQRLRKCPAPALLSLLNRRLRQSAATSTVAKRIKRCENMKNLIRQHLPLLQMPQGNDSSQHLYWLFPFTTSNPDAICKAMANFGYDVPNGTSQLKCVTSFIFDDERCAGTCPNTEQMMSQVLYLPIASMDMSQEEMYRIVSFLKNSASLGIEKNGNKSSSQRRTKRRHVILGIPALVIFLSYWFQVPLLGPMLSAQMLFSKILPFFMACFCAILILLHVMRITMGRYYINCSKAFSKYNSIMTEVKSKDDLDEAKMILEGSGATIIDRPKIHHQSYDLNTQEALLLPTFDHNDTPDKNRVLLTGATGFIGSLLLRELLLFREQLAIKGGVVLIIRPKHNQSGIERAKALLAKEMFSFLTKEEKECLITVIEGDVSRPRLGMSEQDYFRVCNELNISHVINSAACVNFTEPLEKAAQSNITSALQLQELTKNIKSRTKYVYLSTAFIHGHYTGSKDRPLPQSLFKFGKYDPLKLYHSMMDTQSYASAAMNELGFPNTYTFSKSVCEHLLMRDKDVRTIIIRPCIVGPAVQEPFEGWAGDKPSTMVAGACLYLKNPYNLWSFRKERAAVIPVDVVCRFILAKTFLDHEEDQESLIADDASNGISSIDSSKSTEESVHSSEESYVFPKDSDSSSIVDKYSGRRESESCGQYEGRIYTVAWDSSSPSQTGFQWYDFACAVVQLGCAKGHVNKNVAYFVLLVSFNIFLSLDLTLESFGKMHRMLVHWPILGIKEVCNFLGLKPRFLRDLEKFTPFVDLPLLFFPFTSSTFCFESTLKAPPEFNAERYMFSSILAAERFVDILDKRSSETIAVETPSHCDSSIVIAGKKSKKPVSDLLWCISQPNGNYAIRFVGWIVIKLLRAIATEVTIDMDSFTKVIHAIEDCKANASNSKVIVVLAPTHRSYLDFILLSFITFALPEIGIAIPNIAAADDFSRVPILGLLTRMAGAFFVRRGRGVADPALENKIRTLKKRHTDNTSTCIEVFLEGRRSRDRRFVHPKTGFLKCLVKTEGTHVIVPITINYEALPEQACLAEEADGSRKNELSIVRLLKWFKTARANKVNLGRIHISAAVPVLMKDELSLNVKKVAVAVQVLQQNAVFVSQFHIDACASVLDIKPAIIRDSLQELGRELWPGDHNSFPSPQLPISVTERLSIFLHFGHYYSKLVMQSHPKWGKWLGLKFDGPLPDTVIHDNTRILLETLKELFDQADEAVKETVNLLESKGFCNPTPGHVYQYSRQSGYQIPSSLLYPAVLMYLGERNGNVNKGTISDCSVPATPLFEMEDEVDTHPSMASESFGAWGFKDSGFVVKVESNGTKSVIMKGNRYKISGRLMPKLIPFLENETNVEVDPLIVSLPKRAQVTIPSSDLSDNILQALRNIVSNDLERMSTSDLVRARHGTGHSQEDMYMIRSDTLSHIRLPDGVIYPKNENEVKSLVLLAAEKGLCLIPFGGGTNVCHATWCPPKDQDPRPMITVDMRRMNSILSINEEDSTIHVQAGITGGDLVREMASRGYTIGHEPDSIEFSTLGGWIATKASGMKQNRYGNIEGIVKEVRVVSSCGELWQHDNGNGASFARVSTGTDLSSIMLGSEGSLGIITSAIMRIWPIPQVKEYESVILHKFEDGLLFMKDVSKLGALKPASVRLLDNTQFRLGQAMQSTDSTIKSIKRSLTKLTTSLFADSYRSDEIVCATVTFEGSQSEVQLQMQHIRKLAAKHGGLCAGSEIGRSGYDMTYAIAYIRDFAMTYGFLAESFETFVPWSKLRSMINATKDRLKREHEERALPGNPIITCRVTQLYDEGVCVYFYFCMNFNNVKDPSGVFADIELAARLEILAQGGSLSHHHGIGKHRAPLMDNVNSESLKKVFMNLKDAVDPDNVFGVRNGTYSFQ